MSCNKFQEEVNSKVALPTIANEVNQFEPNEEDWWIDNGATKHVTNQKAYFIDFEKFRDGITIQSAGRESLAALGKGTIQIVSTVGTLKKTMTLNDVWYVPNIF